MAVRPPYLRRVRDARLGNLVANGDPRHRVYRYATCFSLRVEISRGGGRARHGLDTGGM